MYSKLYGIFKVFWSHQFKEFEYNFERNSYVYFLLKKAKLMYTEEAAGCIYLNYSRLSVQ